MVESGNISRDKIVEALRGALDELRLMIDSLDPVAEDLNTVLGMMRARMEQRLSQHALQFRWNACDLPPIPDMSAQKVLHVVRILQEAICNVIKHANATAITVSTSCVEAPHGERSVLVEVTDDGIGFGAAVKEGRGLGNMRARAQAIGARLEMASTRHGATVRLCLPLTPATAGESFEAGTAASKVLVFPRRIGRVARAGL
jgi:signal transduction histidine kinase